LVEAPGLEAGAVVDQAAPLQVSDGARTRGIRSQAIHPLRTLDFRLRTRWST